jgi:hypothetical protein
MEYTSLMGVRRCSCATSPNAALLLIIPDRVAPETRQMAGFVASCTNLKTKKPQERAIVFSLVFALLLCYARYREFLHSAASRFALDNRPDVPMIHKTFGDESQS